MNIHNFTGYFGNSSLHFRLLMIIAGVLALGLFAHWFKFNILHLETSIESLGSYAPFAFIILFTAATPFFLSVDALCLASGVMFPLVAGCLYVIISTYLAATVIFILGCYFFQDKVKTLLLKHPKFNNLDTLLVNNSFKVMFLLRLLPLPFALLSYVFSVTEVKFKPYILSTSGILIYNVSLVYFGFTAKHIAKAVSSSQTSSSVNYPLLIFGFIAIILILAFIAHKVRNTISQINPDIAKIKNDY